MPAAAIGVEDGEEAESGAENRERKTSERNPDKPLTALILPYDTRTIYHGEASPATATTRSTKSARRRRNPNDGSKQADSRRYPIR